MFKPEKLELMVCGSRNLDFTELQSQTRYVDGYTKENVIVAWFWEVIHSLSPED